MQKKASRTNSTFGFCLYTGKRKKKPKELFFANARTGKQKNELKMY
jgi:hypothetical protein